MASPTENPFDLTGQTAVILESTDGIGIDAACILRSLGANVVLTTAGSQERLQRAAVTVFSVPWNDQGEDAGEGDDDDNAVEPPSVLARAVDYTDSVATAQLFADLASFNHLVVCCKDATEDGGGEGGADAKSSAESKPSPLHTASFKSLSVDALKAGFEARFFSQYKAAQLALPYLTAPAPPLSSTSKKPKNATITFLSTTADNARAAVGASVINAAIGALVPCLASELASSRIRVNAVSKGVDDARLWTSLVSNAEARQSSQRALAERLGGSPLKNDVAQAVAVLIAHASATGVVVEADGGVKFTVAAASS